MFACTGEIRRLIHTTGPIEGYNRQVRKATGTKGAFPTSNDLRKCFRPARQNIAEPCDRPLHYQALMFSQPS